MLTHPTLEKLQALRLTGMLKGLEEQLQMSGLEERDAGHGLDFGRDPEASAPDV
jgi:hypothetical protein